MRNETYIRDRIFEYVGSNPRNLIFRRNVGLLYTIDGRPIRIGRKGEADLQGVIGGQRCVVCNSPVHPIPVAIEVKDPEGEQSKDQITFQKQVWERRGLLYILASSVDDVKKVIDENH